MKSDQYWRFYLDRVRTGDKVIFDNGAYEGQLVNSDEYILMIQELQPFLHVVPDVLGDFGETQRLIAEFPIIRGQARMEVFQGDGPDEFHHFLEHNKSRWIALPKRLGKRRVEILTYYQTKKNKYPRSVHCLGFIDDDPLAELPHLRRMGVKSIDSSHPVWSAYKGLTQEKFKDNIHSNIVARSEVNKNLNEVFRLCGALESYMAVEYPAREYNETKKQGGSRDSRRPRYDLIPKEFLEGLAEIFEEGLRYDKDNWKRGDEAFYLDCLNHAQDHLSRYNSGDYTENQLCKVAWNVLAVYWYNKQKEASCQQAKKLENQSPDLKQRGLSS